MGSADPPAVRVLTGNSVWFCFRPGQQPHPHVSWGVGTRPGHKTAGIWPCWNRTAVPNLRFVHLWIQLIMFVLLVWRHDQYVDFVE